MDKPPELFKDPKDAEAYTSPLPQPPHTEENEMDGTLEAFIKKHEMFFIVNIDPYEAGDKP